MSHDLPTQLRAMWITRPRPLGAARYPQPHNCVDKSFPPRTQKSGHPPSGSRVRSSCADSCSTSCPPASSAFATAACWHLPARRTSSALRARRCRCPPSIRGLSSQPRPSWRAWPASTCRCARAARWADCTSLPSWWDSPDCLPRKRKGHRETQAARLRICSALASVGSSAASHVTTRWHGPATAPRWHQCQAHFWSSTRRSHADSRSCTVIIRSNTAGAVFNPLSLPPRRGFVQQGLSAAGGALGFYWLGLAADKRYSLDCANKSNRESITRKKHSRSAL